jgi:hypothetical protein
MYFSKREVDLIRAAAAAMPLGGARDPGRAQLSSLVDYAANGTLDALIMDIEARDKAGKVSPAAARALRDMVQAITLGEEERRRLTRPDDPREVDRALRHKRAMALRYVNKLRSPGLAASRPLRRERHDKIKAEQTSRGRLHR